jgi:hypothetical protein
MKRDWFFSVWLNDRLGSFSTDLAEFGPRTTSVLRRKQTSEGWGRLLFGSVKGGGIGEMSPKALRPITICGNFGPSLGTAAA